MCECNPITQFVSAGLAPGFRGAKIDACGVGQPTVACRFTGLKPEKITCSCGAQDIFRRGIKRTCKLRNVKLRVAPECNTVDILAIERGVTTFELTPVPEPPLSVVVSGGGPPLSDAPRVFPTRGNFSSELNPIL